MQPCHLNSADSQTEALIVLVYFIQTQIHILVGTDMEGVQWTSCVLRECQNARPVLSGLRVCIHLDVALPEASRDTLASVVFRQHLGDWQILRQPPAAIRRSAFQVAAKEPCSGLCLMDSGHILPGGAEPPDVFEHLCERR